VTPVPNGDDVGDATLPITGSAFANVNVTVAVAEKKFVSPAFEMDRTHVPMFRAVTRPAVIVQFAVPEATEVDTEPVPPPPVMDTMMPVKRSPFVVAVDNGI
jgi:hypothetical protein